MFTKTHFEVINWGGEEAQDAWNREGLIPHKTKFCDCLMLRKNRKLDFTDDVDHVTCEKCLRKIKRYTENGVDIPRIR